MRILNVGLELPDGSHMHVPDVIRVLRKYGIQFDRYGIVPKGKSERTFIVGAYAGATRKAIYMAAEELDQDAIAMYDVDEMMGDVIGPRDEKWRPFNREYFQVL